MMREKKKRNGKTTPTSGTQTNSLDVKTLKGDTVSNTDSPNSNPITSLNDRRFWDQFIPVMNNYFEDRLNTENKYKINKYNCLRELYKDSGSNQPTQDFTKNIATTYESVIEKIAIENSIDYKALASDGYDAVVNDIEWEYKLTMKQDNSWTGTKKSIKVPNHLLIKMYVENNRISKFGVFMVNLSECKNSSWYSNGDGKPGNFTNLKFSVNDVDKVTCIYGNLITDGKPKWCGVELEELNY